MAQSDLLQSEPVPAFRIASVGEGPDESLWATGFAENTYRIFRRQDNQWSEVIIPQFNGAIQVVTQKLLSNGDFLLGSVGNGAVVSSDSGSTWKTIPFPMEVWGVRRILELPDRSLLAAVMTGSRYVKDVGKVLRSTDQGKSWAETLKPTGSLSGISRLSSNRVVAYTSTLDTSATIHYSDDFGSTWTESKITGLSNPIRGIKFVLELQSGALIAGIEDGKNWKGNFSRGGVLLKSNDGGRNWSVLVNDFAWTSINAGLQATDGRLYIWSGPNVLLSTDEGASWVPFLQTGSGYADTLVKTSLGTFVIAHDKLFRLNSELDEKSLNSWLQ